MIGKMLYRKPNAGSVNPYSPVLNHQNGGKSKLWRSN
jgi:hypothetical protein